MQKRASRYKIKKNYYRRSSKLSLILLLLFYVIARSYDWNDPTVFSGSSHSDFSSLKSSELRFSSRCENLVVPEIRTIQSQSCRDRAC